MTQFQKEKSCEKKEIDRTIREQSTSVRKGKKAEYPKSRRRRCRRLDGSSLPGEFQLPLAASSLCLPSLECPRKKNFDPPPKVAFAAFSRLSNRGHLAPFYRFISRRDRFGKKKRERKKREMEEGEKDVTTSESQMPPRRQKTPLKPTV